MNDMKVFSGRAHPELAQRVCDYLGLSLGKLRIDTFPDGEIWCRIEQDVRGRDVFLVQPTCHPVNENLMELLILIDSFKRASARTDHGGDSYFGSPGRTGKDEGRVRSRPSGGQLITRAGPIACAMTSTPHRFKVLRYFRRSLVGAPVIDAHFGK